MNHVVSRKTVYQWKHGIVVDYENKVQVIQENSIINTDADGILSLARILKQIVEE